MRDIETQVIESILRENEIYYSLSLELRDFQDAFCRQVFTTITEMMKKGLAVNLSTLFAFNQKLGAANLATLEPVSSVNADYFAEQLKNETRKRELSLTVKESHTRSLDKTCNPLEEINRLNTELLRIAEHRDVSVHIAKDILFTTLDYIEKVRANGGDIDTIETGFYDFDKLVGGFRPGEEIVIAARPSIGKTALALTIALNMALANHKVLFFSSEMSERLLMQRMISGLGQVSHEKLVKGILSHTDLASIHDAAVKINDLWLWIDDTPNIRYYDLRNKARMMRSRGVEAIFIDYLTLVQYGDSKTPRFERVGELSREIKALARELSVPIIVLSQLGRDAEGQKPKVSNLRQSGEIEENADMIILMDRERDAGLTEINVAKNRNGPTGKFDMVLLPEYVKFAAADKHHE
jgi:replicative DNA helicase